MAESDQVMGVTADYGWTAVQEYGSLSKPTVLPGMQSLRYRPPTAGEGRLSDPCLGGRAEIPEDEERSWDVSRPIREAPFSMLKKRLLRQFRSQSSGTVSSWKMWIAARQQSVKHFRTETRNVLSYMEIWKKSLHHIEGHFGTGIRSYFSFLRFLVLLNLCTFLIIALFVMIPIILFERQRGEENGKTTASPPQSGNCTEYDPTRKGLVSFYEYALDILSGTGLLEVSYLFYGFYPLEKIDMFSCTYNLSVAYLLTFIAYFLITFSWIVHSAVMGFKHSQLHADGTLSNYSNKIFTAWDFCISQESAVQLKHNSIRYELQMDLQEEFLRKEIAERTKYQRFRIYLARLLVNVLILTMIGAAFYAISKATQFSQANTKDSGIIDLLIQYLPSVVITAANSITPLIFNQLIRFEQYSPATEIKLSLIRSVFLKLASLGVLLYTLWDQITCKGEMTSASSCQPCGYNYRQYQCWETKIGQEMYKLMLFDLLIGVLVMILVDFPRKIIVQYSKWKAVQLWGEQEFLVPLNVLEIVYGQTVCWIGCFFSPALPLLNTVKYILIFYLKKLTLFTNCRPSNRTFRASSSIFFFLVVLLFGLALALVPFTYSITSIHPSRACGPFRNLDSIWDTVPRLVNGLPHNTRTFLNFIGSLPFLVPLFALSSVVLLFLVVKSSGYTDTISRLKRQLHQEGRDKQFLVKKIAALNVSSQ